MRRYRRGARLRRAVLTLPLLAPLLLVGAPAVGAAEPVARPVADAPARGDVQMRIDDVTPSVAPRSSGRAPLLIKVTLTNTSGSPLADVRIQGVRGNPVGNQRALDDAIADDSPPSDGIDVPATRPLRVNLPAGTPVATTFVTTISVLDDGRGLCQCLDAVYPIYLVASTTDDAGKRTVLGSAATFVPSQVQNVTPAKVSWVWPLLDRPHRLGSDDTFVDDDLAASVAGGRLDRSLQVIERLRPTTPITLVVDPELLDELEVMASGKYTVRTSTGTTPGTGQAVARAWLDRFAAVLQPGRAVQISLTPYADPDIQSLATADLTWSTELPKPMQQRVTGALLGRELATDVAWPAGGTVGRKALDAMATSGVTTVVMDGSALSPSTVSGIPVAVARLRSSSGTLTAAATSAAMQRQVAQAVETEQTGSTGANALPYLIAEIAVRALQTGKDPSQAVLTPPRYVDPSPDRAARTIEDTSTSVFATPVAVRDLSAERPSKVSSLRSTAPTSASTGLPAVNLEAADTTTSSLPAITSLLARDTDAQPLITGLGYAAQRITSSAWRPVSGSLIDTSIGTGLARDLSDQVEKLLDGVRIITPSSGSYTLGSEESKLPITVENTLPYTVEVQLQVAAVGNVPGYTVGDIKPQRITADAKQTLQVPSRLDRSGRIPVKAQLTTPTGRVLGEPVLVYVRSTVFGTIGIVITLVAGGVLALALIVRFIRRLQRLRRKAGRADRPTDDTPESVNPSGVGAART